MLCVVELLQLEIIDGCFLLERREEVPSNALMALLLGCVVVRTEFAASNFAETIDGYMSIEKNRRVCGGHGGLE